jgi:hypothetical protein
MKIKNTDVQKIEEAFSEEWVTAKELKHKLKLSTSTQKLGRMLAQITKNNPDIESGMKGHTLAYRKTQAAQNEPKPSEEEKISQVTTPEIKTEADMEKNLSNLINDLKAEGMDVQEICYNALRESKEKYDTEIGFVKTNASMVYTELTNLKNRIKKLLNQIDDYKDRLRQFEMKNIVKSVSEERNQRKELLA